MDLVSYSKIVKENNELFAEVLSACKFLLFNQEKAKKAKDYIFSRVTNSSINKFDIGFFPSSSDLSLLTSLVDINILYRLGLVYKTLVDERNYKVERNVSFFNNHNLIFPIRDVRGNVIALSGRTILNKEEQTEFKISKYKNSSYTKSVHLFGLNFARKSIEQTKSVIIVEGQLDCISCHQNGFHNVVGITGSSFSPYQLFLLKRMANKIYLLLDNDDAGKKEKNRIKKKFSNLIKIEDIELPDNYKDVDGYFKESPTNDIFIKTYC